MLQIPALSVRQPWAHAIVHLNKDIENRSRAYAHRGPLLIHASAGCTRHEYLSAEDWIGREIGRPVGLPDLRDIDLGGIVGIVDVVDCVSGSESPWWMGPHGLVLQNPRPLPFTPCRGTIAPLFWYPAADVMARLSPHIHPGG